MVLWNANIYIYIFIYQVWHPTNPEFSKHISLYSIIIVQSTDFFSLYTRKTCTWTNILLRSNCLLNGLRPEHGIGGWYYPSQWSNGRTTKGTCDIQH
jgi:hypothetical protein